jgi:RadC-like JAB domain
MAARRYRLKLATWTVVRESSGLSPKTLSSPAAVAELARDLLREHDDGKQHFWAIFLNCQNHYLLHTLVSTGTQSALLVLPREVLGPRFERAPHPWSWFTTIRAGTRLRRGRTCASPVSSRTPRRFSTCANPYVETRREWNDRYQDKTSPHTRCKSSPLRAK